MPQGTHRANHSGSPRPELENEIVRKCMAELGISGEAMAGAEGTMASTTGEAGFGEKEFGSPRGTLFIMKNGEFRRRIQQLAAYASSTSLSSIGSPVGSRRSG